MPKPNWPPLEPSKLAAKTPAVNTDPVACPGPCGRRVPGTIVVCADCRKLLKPGTRRDLWKRGQAGALAVSAAIGELRGK